MTPEPLTEEAVFQVARKIRATDARADYLRQVCADNDDLRARVKELLRAHDEEQSFLESPAAAPFVPTITDRRVTEAPGTQIGPYKLLEQIGEGGFGIVYMAEQSTPVRRKVALKVLKLGMDTREVIARFEAERQALALMDHPHIAKVFDGGATDSGRPYFVMELVRGVPITDFCDQNHLTPRERLELFITVCRAVQHAHQKGIIHRDIKPSNVLVTLLDDKPVVKVIDFGVAKALGQELTEKTLCTSFAQMIGTPLYMSPEQAGQSSLDIDTRSDIYSLGVLLYELLTGTTPFDKQRLKEAAFGEIQRIIREEAPPRPSTRLSDLGKNGRRAPTDRLVPRAEAVPASPSSWHSANGTRSAPAAFHSSLASISAVRKTEPHKLSRLMRGELDWIVMKALEKDRSRRYGTAMGLASDIQHYLADEPVAACSPSAAYQLRKFVRRNKGPVLAAAVVVLALVAGIIGTTWGMFRATHAEAAAEVALADAKDTLWLSLYEQARARRFTRQMGQRVESLDALVKAAAIRSDERLRDEAIAAMALPDVSLGPNWHARFPVHHPWCFDPQYRLLASVSDQGVISVCSVPDNREIQNIEGAPIKSNGAWIGRFSPDGQYLATVELGNAPLRVWRVADRKAIIREDLPQTLGWAFSPDSRQLAVGQRGWVIRFELATGQELNRWQLPHSAPAYSLAFHSDNRRLAVGYYDSLSVVSVYDATNGELVSNLPIGGSYEQVVAWHPDGERLAVASSDPIIQIWNVAAKRRVATLDGHAQTVSFLSFHPGGELLTSTSWDGTVRLWDPSTARQVMQLPMHVMPQFSSDGRWLGIALRGEEAKMLEVSITHEYRTLVSSHGAGQGSYNSGDISPDGRMLALGMDVGTRLWDLPSGRELARLPDASNAAFFERRGERWDLLTSTTTGLHRWPARIVGSSVQLSPPQQLSPRVFASFARSPEGRTLAAAHQSEDPIQILDLERGVVRQTLGVHSKGEGHALSPDGRWLASRGWQSDRVWLWNVESRQRVEEWIVNRASVFFTPDSRTLIISQGDEFSFHDVETPVKPFRRIRRDVPQFPGHVAFSPDGGLMALEMAPGVIHLKDAASARTVARLEDPTGDRAGWMSFTPDGTQLVVAAPYAHAVHIWDLRAIRRRLKGIGLDWDWPEFEPATSPHNVDEPLRVEIVPADPVKPTPPGDSEVRQGIELRRSSVETNSVDESEEAATDREEE